MTGQTERNGAYDCVVVGAGITGLTLAHRLCLAGRAPLVLERSARIGGQIQTYRRDGFIYESGPTTGIISCPEVAQLFGELGGDILQTALPSARRRLILKRGAFRPLPSSLSSAISTELFTWSDKLRVLLEPFRRRGTNPHESVEALVRRRLGDSFYTYAVEPFIGGIYAGDATHLVTKYALPKLYALEQRYGSFVRGALCKALGSGRRGAAERQATGEVFSARGGLSTLIEALADSIGREGIITSAEITRLAPTPQDTWQVHYKLSGGEARCLEVPCVATTVGTSELTALLPDAPHELTAPLLAMRYAPVVQVAAGYKRCVADFDAFGGLVPSVEDMELLGILNPAAAFEGRAPRGGMLLSLFLGGMRNPRTIDRTDQEISATVREQLSVRLGIIPAPKLLHIFRHRKAIPQYEASTAERLASIAELERLYPRLVIGGNMHGGIGMGDRIAQAFRLAERIDNLLTPHA